MKSRSPLFTLFFTVFLDLLGFGMVIPILALYAKSFHVSDVSVTALGASYSAMQLVFAPVWGRISDRYGRRPVLLVSILGSAVSQFGYAVAPSFAWLVVARCCAGICGANIAAAQAYIADSTDEKSRAANLGMLGAAFGLGFVLGPAFGGLLAPLGHQVPFFAASGLACINLVLAWFTLVEPRPQGERKASRALSWEALARTVASPRLLTLILLFFVITFGFAQLEGTFPLYLARRFQFSERDVGWVFSGIGLIMIFVQGLLVRRLVARFGERRLVIAGTLLMSAGMAFLYAGRHLPALVASMVLVSIGNGLNTPSLSSLISRSAAGDRQGGVLGVSQSFSALARILGPVTGGWLLGFGDGTPYLAAAVIMLIACLYAGALVQQPVLPAAPVEAPAIT